MTTPLDYSGLPTRSESAGFTPVRRRQRRRFLVALGIGVVLCLIPYPTVVFPAVTLQFVDAAGRAEGFGGPIHWVGMTNVGSVGGTLRCDANGRVVLPNRRVWASVAGRLFAQPGRILPYPTRRRWVGGARAVVYFEAVWDVAGVVPARVTPAALGGGSPVGSVPAPVVDAVWFTSSVRCLVCVSFPEPAGAARAYDVCLRGAGASTRPGVRAIGS